MSLNVPSTQDQPSTQHGPAPETLPPETLPGLVERQRAAHARDGYPGAEVRRDRLTRLIRMLRASQGEFVAAAEADFGSRPAFETRMELASIVDAARHAAANLPRWMRPERAKLPILLRLTGARAEILTQPLGVVGIVAPWNFPFQLSLAPAVAALAAGNRVMLKPSELSPASSKAVARAVERHFSPEEFTVVLGETEVARAFCALPFDHLLYTGSGRVGVEVMRAAAASDVVTDINSRPHPLALSYFGRDRAHLTRFQREVPSGGMTVNDVLMHAGFETLPFGGVGGSGMGAYRGRTGFDTFSHRRSVFYQGRISMARIAAPPHTPRQSSFADRALGPMPRDGA